MDGCVRLLAISLMTDWVPELIDCWLAGWW